MLNVIDPTVAYVGEHFAGQSIGLIGTKQTVNSGVYEQKIRGLGQDIRLQSLVTLLLAPMIEEGFSTIPSAKASFILIYPTWS